MTKVVRGEQPERVEETGKAALDAILATVDPANVTVLHLEDGSTLTFFARRSLDEAVRDMATSLACAMPPGPAVPPGLRRPTRAAMRRANAAVVQAEDGRDEVQAQQISPNSPAIHPALPIDERFGA